MTCLTAPVVHSQAVLRAAHEMEAGMGYMEPPRLYQPVKHCLGYVLMQAGNPQKAAEVRTGVYPAKGLAHCPRGCLRSDGSLHECINTGPLWVPGCSVAVHLVLALRKLQSPHPLAL